ncbi:MAG: hypothetical protein U0163_04190 [Gemmatimonadaceae bacterium]
MFVGVTAGLFESAVIKMGSAVLHLPTGGLAPLELFWMVPLAASACLLAVAVLILLLARGVPALARLPVRGGAIPTFVAISVYSAIRSLRLGIAWYAAVLLAAGVGTVIWRLVSDP